MLQEYIASSLLWVNTNTIVSDDRAETENNYHFRSMSIIVITFVNKIVIALVGNFLDSYF